MDHGLEVAAGCWLVWVPKSAQCRENTQLTHEEMQCEREINPALEAAEIWGLFAPAA